MISCVSYKSVFFCSGVVLWIRIKDWRNSTWLLTHEHWEMQSPTSYSDGLVMSESHHLLVAAALAPGGFSRSQHGLFGHLGSSSDSRPGPARGSAVCREPAAQEAAGPAEREKPQRNKWFWHHAVSKGLKRAHSSGESCPHHVEKGRPNSRNIQYCSSL